MANIKRENIGLLNDKITVTISRNDYIPPFEKSLKTHSKSAQLPGFRKGMVPTGLIRKLHGQSLLTEEVLRLVETELNGFLQQEKLDIFGQPLPLEDQSVQIDLNTPQDYTFPFEIGLVPKFEVSTLNPGTRLSHFRVEINEQMIDEEIEQLQSRKGRMVEEESFGGGKSQLTGLFEAYDAQGNPSADQTNNKELVLWGKYFRESFLKESLSGKKAGDVLILKLGSAFDEQEFQWVARELGLDPQEAGLGEREYRLTLTKIQTRELRELSGTFFDEVFGPGQVNTLEEFRIRIRSELEDYYEKQSGQLLQNELFEKMIHETELELPREFLMRLLNRSAKTPQTREQLEQEYPGFDHQLRWDLISQKLIREQDLKVSPEEIRGRLAGRVISYLGLGQVPADTSLISAYVDRLQSDKKSVDEVTRELLREKVLDWAATQVSLDEHTLDLEAFRKLADKTHHHAHP